MPLSQAKDAAFAEGIMGKGVVIEPTVGEVVAPFDGTIMTLFPTNHAIGIISDDGMELLIHIGIDTIQLEGKHFEVFVKQGDTVKKEISWFVLIFRRLKKKAIAHKSQSL